MDSSTPPFTVGQEIASFLVSYGILSKAWGFRGSNTESFTLKEVEGIAYVAFPSFHDIEDFFVKESKYGEGNIQTDNNVFSDCLKGNDNKPALVHQGALKLFLHILKNTDFEAELQIYTDRKQKKLKPIIFVGHSLGGAVATLATLWVLEKRLRNSSPFCVTFGCPLVGDSRLVEAVRRENWAGNFCHLISKYDIVPRMLLAPFQSIVKPLTAIFPYWQGILAYPLIQDDCRTLLENVLKYTSKEANNALDPIKALDGANDERSPYRPFGTYMLCSSHGAACVENSEAVLNLLHCTMPSQQKYSDDIVRACISEHKDYGSVLEHVRQYSKSGREIGNSNLESSYTMGILLQLQAMGFEIQALDKNTRASCAFLELQNVEYAKNALLKAGTVENIHNMNVSKLAIDLSEAQRSMTELEWYKEYCEREDGNTYYDSFKKQNDKKDIRVNVDREKLLRFWDGIIEMWESNELPCDFQSQNKWINAGNTYRKLVEPLDIAYYYNRHGNSNYLSDGRPNRHKILQKWMEEKEKTRGLRGQRPRTKAAALTEDSCLWAYVEEARRDLENLKQGQLQSLGNLEELEDNVTRMINTRSISLDVFLETSSFMTWWEEWKEYNKKQYSAWSSPLYEIMQSEGWKV